MELLDPLTFALAFFIIFLGALTQSLIGFGLAIVASPLLYIIDPSLVPVPVMLLGLALASLNLYRERASFEFKELTYAFFGRIPGSFIGGGLLLAAPQAVLGLLIAAIVYIAVLFSIYRITAPVNKISLFIAGVISGIFGTIAAIGGPVLAILLAGKNAHQFRASLSFFFIFSAFISLGVLSLIGLVDWQHLVTSLMLLPAIILGYLLAGKWINNIDTPTIKTVTYLLCTFCATILTGKSLYMLLT